MTSRRSRKLASVTCGTLGLLLVFVSVLIGYTRRSLFDERAFSIRVASSLENPHVAGFAAQQIADAVIGAKPDLIGVRPLLVGLCQSIVSSPPFRAAVRRGARVLHHSITTGQAREIVLTVKDVGAVFESAVATQPELVKKLPKGVTTTLGRLESLPGGERAAAIVRFAGRVRALAIGLLVLGVALCVVSVRLADERRRSIVRLGLGLTGLALVLAITARFGGAFLSLSMRHDELAPVLAGVAGAFLSGLMIWAIALGLTGLVVAAASASLLERVPIAAWFDGGRRWLIGPQPRMRVRLLRGLLGAGAGAAILMWPGPSLTVLAWFAGGIVAFAGLRESFIASLHLLPQMEPKVARTRGETPRGPSLGRAMALVGGLALLAIAGMVWIVTRPDAEAAVGEVRAYNGLPQLGDRRLDEVVFPTTHNSMGGGDVEGWMFPNQSAGIRRQLDDGIRGFLLDIHYGVPAGNYIKTHIDSAGNSMEKYAREVGDEGMKAATRIRDRLVGVETGKMGIYMCHGFCELGALGFVDALEEMRDFLVANPGEVLVVVLQDESVAAADIERCFVESGLIDFVYKGPLGPPWPTLREMVESDQRVLVMTENLRDGIAWCHPAFDVLQETPYTFHAPTEFSNAPNRGSPKGTLFLMNHWIESTPMPKPSNALVVNTRDVLRERIRKFRKERGHVPNLVAVDFYQEGDLVAVVRELNEGR